MALTFGQAEAERLLRELPERRPGVKTRWAVQAVGRAAGVRHASVLAILRRLEEHGALQRRAWRRGSLLFPPCEDLDDWWMQAAVLQEPNLEILYLVVREGPRTPADLQKVLATRHGWPGRTTRDRLATLLRTDLLRLERNSHFVRIHANPPHAALEKVRESA